MNIKPLFDNVVLIPVKHSAKQGAIILPAQMEEKSEIAEVLAVGNSKDMQLKVHDKVLYNKFASSEFIFENKTYIIIKQIDILAVIEEGEM